MKNRVMRLKTLFASVLIGYLLQSVIATQIKLRNNGYEDLVLAINPSVPENPLLIDKLMEIWTDASRVLYEATRNRAYFRKIKILIPTTWNTTYDRARTESYDQADVLIADANPVHGDVPYTLQYGGCGDHGNYIHLTEDFVMQESFVQVFGDKGKVLVHEWAHLRWGVFDEGPTSGYDQFYYDSNGNIHATKCPNALSGKMVNINTGELCERLDSANGLPEQACVFVVNDNQGPNLSASLLSHQFIEQVKYFCNDENDGPNENIHNKDAPNEQNRLCDQRSTWDVIKHSADFFDADLNLSINNSVTVNDTTPQFDIVQHQSWSKNYVLVMDTSGSMQSVNKFPAMISAATSFINNWAAKDSKIGIVDFDDDGKIKRYLTSINTTESRAYLTQAFTSMSAYGGTDIDDGIRKGITILEREGDPSGGRLIVLTDGEGTIGGTTEEVLQKGIIVDSIFIGVSVGNEELQYLSDESQGHTCIVYDVSSTSSLSQCFISLSSTSSSPGNTETGDIFQIHSKKYENANIAVTGNVLIDPSIGKDTVFTVTWSYSTVPLEISLFDPDTVRYCNDPSIHSDCQSVAVTTDATFQTITFDFPGIAKAGRWQYYISFRNQQTIVATVTSYANDAADAPPIVVTSGISTKDVSNPASPLVVYAQVTQGFKPVVGVNVTATVTDPNSGQWVLKLQDAGAAPDVRADDGVYSKYYMWYSSPGRYSVQVSVESDGSAGATTKAKSSMATFNYGYIADDGSIHLNTNPSQDTSIDFAEVDAFERIAAPKAFEYNGPTVTPGVTDLFPPSKVTDLLASQQNISDITEGFLVVFHAPGDDFDDGKASSYDMRYTVGSSYDLSTDFDSQTPVTDANILEGNLNSPKQAGEEEKFILRFDGIQFDSNTTRIGIALRTKDENNNTASVSNVCSFPVFLRKPNLYMGDPIPTTTAHSTTTTAAVPEEPVTEWSVSFFGAQLDDGEAEIVLYVLFSTLLLAIIILFFCATRCIRVGRGNKNAERYQPDEDRDEQRNQPPPPGWSYEQHQMNNFYPQGQWNPSFNGVANQK